jgi:hypothetical protein
MYTSSWSANNPLIRRNKLLIITLLPFFIACYNMNGYEVVTSL